MTNFKDDFFFFSNSNSPTNHLYVNSAVKIFQSFRPFMYYLLAILYRGDRIKTEPNPESKSATSEFTTTTPSTLY
jgi:hypothetical protein